MFGDGPPAYFDQVYEEIRRIVRDELTTVQIDLIAARLTGVLDWQRRIYAPKNPRQATGRERRKLFEDVERQLRSMEDAIAILMHERWRRPGMSVFMTAGGMYLALCQEACFMDPNTDDPTMSSYFKTIQLTAPGYADSLERTFRELLHSRIDAVHLEKGTRNIRVGRKNYMTETFRWNDPISGTKGRVHAIHKKDDKTFVGKPREEATADLENYKRGLPASFAREMGQPEEVAGKWRQLVDQPLP